MLTYKKTTRSSRDFRRKSKESYRVDKLRRCVEHSEFPSVTAKDFPIPLVSSITSQDSLNAAAFPSTANKDYNFRWQANGRRCHAHNFISDKGLYDEQTDSYGNVCHDCYCPIHGRWATGQRIEKYLALLPAGNHWQSLIIKLPKYLSYETVHKTILEIKKVLGQALGSKSLVFIVPHWKHQSVTHLHIGISSPHYQVFTEEDHYGLPPSRRTNAAKYRNLRQGLQEISGMEAFERYGGMKWEPGYSKYDDSPRGWFEYTLRYWTGWKPEEMRIAGCGVMAVYKARGKDVTFKEWLEGEVPNHAEPTNHTLQMTRFHATNEYPPLKQRLPPTKPTLVDTCATNQTVRDSVSTLKVKAEQREVDCYAIWLHGLTNNKRVKAKEEDPEESEFSYWNHFEPNSPPPAAENADEFEDGLLPL